MFVIHLSALAVRIIECEVHVPQIQKVHKHIEAPDCMSTTLLACLCASYTVAVVVFNDCSSGGAG